MTDYFFMELDLGTASFGNGSLFTELKKKSPFIKCFGHCILILMSILTIVVEHLKILNILIMKVFNMIMIKLILEAKKFAHGLLKEIEQ